MCSPTAPVRFLPPGRFRNVAPDPEHEQRRQYADQIQVAPGAGTGRPNGNPDGGGKNASDRVSALQKCATLAARLVRPKLSRDRGPRRPFRADREPNEKAKYSKRQPIPGESAQASEQRIGKDRKGHRPLAADIIGQYAAEQATRPPTEDGYRNDRAGIERNVLVFGWVKELVQCRANGENKRKHLETVERPPEVRGDQRFPLRPVQRAIPWGINGVF